MQGSTQEALAATPELCVAGLASVTLSWASALWVGHQGAAPDRWVPGGQGITCGFQEPSRWVVSGRSIKPAT